MSLQWVAAQASGTAIGSSALLRRMIQVATVCHRVLSRKKSRISPCSGGFTLG